MGMDVYGNNPSAEAGEYFRNSIWEWHPLADYIQLIAPQIASRCPDWHNNSGAGLDAADAVALADCLQAEIDSGRCAQYAMSRGPGNQGILDEATKQFHENLLATIRGKAEESGDKIQPAGLNDGEPHYPFSVENVQDFVDFLRGCGGFKII